MTRSFIIYLFILSILIINTKSELSGDDDTRFSVIEPKLIQQPAGKEIKIRCGIRNNQTEYLGISETNWYFKSCNVGYNRILCTNTEEMKKIPWAIVKCDGGEPCKKLTLTIKNATEADSGLYNCRIQPSRANNETILFIPFFKTYNLEVIDSTIQPPEFVGEFPANITTAINNQVVFQCRIYSKVPPTIKWLRRIDTISSETSSHLSFQYDSTNTEQFQTRFELLESSGEKELTDDTHLSKLIINNVSENDVGVYVCVGINLQGFKYREAYLSLIQDRDTGNGEIKQFLLLFLIPLGFISIPLLIWSCYVFARFRRRQKMGSDVNFVNGGQRKPMILRQSYKRQQTKSLVIYEI